MYIPHIKVTFPTLAEVFRLEVVQESREEELDLASLICLYAEKFSMNAITSPEDDLTSTIRPCVLGETIDYWTIEPCFVMIFKNFVPFYHYQA